MENMLIVKVIKCSNETWWYTHLVGVELNVLPHDESNYCLYGNPILIISKQDVKVIAR